MADFDYIVRFDDISRINTLSALFEYCTKGYACQVGSLYYINKQLLK